MCEILDDIYETLLGYNKCYDEINQLSITEAQELIKALNTKSDFDRKETMMMLLHQGYYNGLIISESFGGGKTTSPSDYYNNLFPEETKQDLDLNERPGADVGIDLLALMACPNVTVK